MERQTGVTTRQMEKAPKNSVFVWCNGHTSYPSSLAKKIGREDLEIVSPDWLLSDRWRGRIFGGVVVDHTADLTLPQRKALLHLLACVQVFG